MPVMELTTLAYVALIIIACASIVIAIGFVFLVKALLQNTQVIQSAVSHLDKNLNQALESVQKSINDVNVITKRVSEQMDRVDSIVGNIETATGDARHSVHMVNSTVVPMLANLHGVMAGVKKGVDTWKASAAEEVYEPEPPNQH
jgi:uncharacterized protein YoxC